MLQKRAIWIIHKIGSRDRTNSLFLKSKILKFIDLVHFQIAQILYKAKITYSQQYSKIVP